MIDLLSYIAKDQQPKWLQAYVKSGDIDAWNGLLTRISARDISLVTGYIVNDTVTFVMTIGGRQSVLRIWGPGWSAYAQLVVKGAGGNYAALKWIGCDMHCDELGIVLGTAQVGNVAACRTKNGHKVSEGWHDYITPDGEIKRGRVR